MASVLKALAVHLAVVLLLFVSFSSAPEFEPAKPIVQATLVQLNSKSPAQTQTDQRIAGEAARTAAQRHEAEELKRDQQKQEQAEAAAASARAQEQAAEAAAAQQREEQQKAATAATQEKQQKAAAAATQEKQQEAAKQLEAAKQAEAEAQRKADAARKLAAEEAAKKAAAEAARKKTAEEAAKKQAAEQAQSKAAEEAKRKAAAAKAEAEKAAQQKRAQEEARAKALADLLADETQYQQAQADLSGDEVAASYDDLIRRYVSEQWRRPPSARNGMVVDVVISMLPTGQITDAVVVRTSGDPGFDQSAVQAVRNVGRIPEMQQLSREKPATFDSLYRKRTLRFKPEDLSF
ncbi:cell envelope integrity protein TolA [Halopseudomonas sp.]|uniref:cell envelope integrity protein TolA n=1 Tax=Halopseudomonas sp. TaxID=2901191 RepID=UPI0035659EA3